MSRDHVEVLSLTERLGRLRDRINTRPLDEATQRAASGAIWLVRTGEGPKGKRVRANHGGGLP
jgi:hypothetical protein